MFPSIDRVHEILDEIAESLPKVFYKELNGGIFLMEEEKIHPKSIDKSPLYIMGEYIRGLNGRSIKIYYGSFRANYYYYGEDILYEKLRETLVHEFVHHLESLGGEKSLELEDKIFMAAYLSKAKLIVENK